MTKEAAYKALKDKHNCDITDGFLLFEVSSQEEREEIARELEKLGYCSSWGVRIITK